MKSSYLVYLFCLSSLLLPRAVVANDKTRHPARGGAGQHQASPAASPAGQPVVRARVPGKEPWLDVKVIISEDERKVIQTHVQHCQSSGEHRKKAKGLPPGLAKRVARGGDLPPGWQKKCVRGEVMPRAVYGHCHPLPPEVVVKLPPPPPGTILVTIDGKVVRLAKATLEILDVFEVKL